MGNVNSVPVDGVNASMADIQAMAEFSLDCELYTETLEVVSLRQDESNPYTWDNMHYWIKHQSWSPPENRWDALKTEYRRVIMLLCLADRSVWPTKQADIEARLGQLP